MSLRLSPNAIIRAGTCAMALAMASEYSRAEANGRQKLERIVIMLAELTVDFCW
jgi:hypothetical protein